MKIKKFSDFFDCWESDYNRYWSENSFINDEDTRKIENYV